MDSPPLRLSFCTRSGKRVLWEATGATFFNGYRIPAKVDKAVKIALNTSPSADKISNAWLPPGQSFTITGTNFGTDASNVKLFLGPVECQITSVTPTTIVGITPAVYNGYTWGYYEPIHITIGGKSVKNKLVLSCAD